MGKVIRIEDSHRYYIQGRAICKKLGITDKDILDFAFGYDSYNGHPEYYNLPGGKDNCPEGYDGKPNGPVYEDLFINVLSWWLFLMRHEFWPLDVLLGKREGEQEDYPDPRLTDEMEEWCQEAGGYIMNKHGIK
jgi:hypothetical protein